MLMGIELVGSGFIVFSCLIFLLNVHFVGQDISEQQWLFRSD
jgi:hypothetical protein